MRRCWTTASPRARNCRTRWTRPRSRPARRSSCSTSTTSHQRASLGTGRTRRRTGRTCPPQWRGAPRARWRHCTMARLSRHSGRSAVTKALHEVAHGLVAAKLGGRDIDMSVNREQGWAGVCVARLPGGLREQLAFALAGHVAARALVGGAVRVSELADLLELERRDDLARAVERDPALAASALRLVERIVSSPMPQTEKAAAA